MNPTKLNNNHRLFTQQKPTRPGFVLYSPTQPGPDTLPTPLTVVARPDGELAIAQHGTPVKHIPGWWANLHVTAPVPELAVPTPARQFAHGKLAVTPGLMDTVPPEEWAAMLGRHLRCDWGDLGAEDKSANEEALHSDGRLLSAYRTSFGDKVYVITEWDRSATTVLLASEY